MNLGLKKRVDSRKGAIELSFGMIFSIILIIVFLGAGFYAIMKFIEWQRLIQVESFLKEFQDDIDKMWNSAASNSQTRSYSLPTTINAVCFTNDDFQNLEFSSTKMIKGKFIEHIDIAKITKDEDPFCIQNIRGKVNLRLVKDYGDALVTVER